ncbi:ABC transporter ATP-binding protein [Spiroplasma gladiatoris]|uniref:ABC transporter ATP-binding protein n=1 Tax=Spiroplasma gladiatoris TaxID=2143 RepID=A0A4P7AJM1_9MOLU|nr:ABC transporter ATP-binding protein [Spiroplasma gladiatoris]QBQ08008.1 ABC transporter ATP-binding protein [Spiroplasma gladiatoris]
MKDYVIEFKNYEKKFKKGKIGPLDFNIEKGKITAILGSSGSGKSVAIKTMIGAISKFSGEVKVCGYSKKKRNAHLANKFISFYTQMDFSLYEMNVVTYLKNMSIVLGIKSSQRDEIIDYWLEFFDLKKDKDKQIKNFSWGMQNRLSLIICAMKNSDIFVLDEPGANLDSAWRNKLKNLLIDYKKKGKTILFTSHNIDEVNDLIDYYVILGENGNQMFKGSKEELDLYSKYKLYFCEDFDYEGLKTFLNSKNIKVFKHDKIENSIVFATRSTKEINWVFLYLIKETSPVQNLVRLPINMNSIYKAIEGKDTIKKVETKDSNKVEKERFLNKKEIVKN